ncbi:hypothetical protein RFI_05758 [Reticulomyxa filosa]|uniref:Uncharacterized protein n=1 Tax=Reticulomyxa filosa TaxID=46433 RepID=X6P1E8_RETFI|nr:hypothetical protein RFI_05758 [Reticulomyxa filosa]|eukprot:ETO31362.1 hypothetical protein RFI_05758 [Reticulomyxa filosa]
MVIGFFYLLFTTHLSTSQVLALAQSLGNLFGLMLAIITVGYGLVEIPRFFWHRSNYEKRIQHLIWKLAQLQNEKDDANDRVDEYVHFFQRIEKKCGKDESSEMDITQIQSRGRGALLREQRQIVKDLLLTHNLYDKQIPSPDITQEQIQQQIERGNIQEKLLDHCFVVVVVVVDVRIVRIHAELKVWLFELERSEAWWYKTAHDILVLQMSLKQKNKELAMGNSLQHSNIEKQLSQAAKNSKHTAKKVGVKEEEEDDDDDDEDENQNDDEETQTEEDTDLTLVLNTVVQPSYDEMLQMNIINRCYWFGYTYIVPILQKIFAVFLGLLSLAIIWSEIALAFNVNFSIFAIVANHTSNNIGKLIFGSMMFAYASTCSLFSLWRLRLGQLYHMHSHHLTDESSLLSNAAFCTRLMYSLGFNFILVSNASNRSSYSKLFTQMNRLPLLGNPVNTFLPFLIFLFCLTTWFNLYGKVLLVFGGLIESREVAEQIAVGETLMQKFKRSLRSDNELREKFEAQFSKWTSQSLQVPSPKHSKSNVTAQFTNQHKATTKSTKISVTQDKSKKKGTLFYLLRLMSPYLIAFMLFVLELGKINNDKKLNKNVFK